MPRISKLNIPHPHNITKHLVKLFRVYIIILSTLEENLTFGTYRNQFFPYKDSQAAYVIPIYIYIYTMLSGLDSILPALY